MARNPRATTHRSSARFSARVLPGAAPAPHPGFIAPCEPKLKRTPPTGERWLSEIKHDGYRVQAHLDGGRARLFTRRGYDWTPRFAALAGALTEVPANSLVLDGEVIVQGETGVADFDALQADLASGRSERMVYFAFDLLYLDGFDLRNAPLIERKRILGALLDEAKSECFHLAQHLEVAPALVFEQACVPLSSMPRSQSQAMRAPSPGSSRFMNALAMSPDWVNLRTSSSVSVAFLA